MDHYEWAAQLKTAMLLRCETPDKAVAALRSLSKKMAEQARRDIGDWHVEQTMGLEAAILSESEDHKAAAFLLGRINKNLKGQLAYYARALSSSLAFEAFELSASGQKRRAGVVATEAMKFFEGHPESSAIYERLLGLSNEEPAKRKAPQKRGKKKTA